MLLVLLVLLEMRVRDDGGRHWLWRSRRARGAGTRALQKAWLLDAVWTACRRKCSGQRAEGRGQSAMRSAAAGGGPAIAVGVVSGSAVGRGRGEVDRLLADPFTWAESWTGADRQRLSLAAATRRAQLKQHQTAQSRSINGARQRTRRVPDVRGEK